MREKYLSLVSLQKRGSFERRCMEIMDKHRCSVLHFSFLVEWVLMKLGVWSFFVSGYSTGKSNFLFTDSFTYYLLKRH